MVPTTASFPRRDNPQRMKLRERPRDAALRGRHHRGERRPIRRSDRLGVRRDHQTSIDSLAQRRHVRTVQNGAYQRELLSPGEAIHPAIVARGTRHWCPVGYFYCRRSTHRSSCTTSTQSAACTPSPFRGTQPQGGPPAATTRTLRWLGWPYRCAVASWALAW